MVFFVLGFRDKVPLSSALMKNARNCIIALILFVLAAVFSSLSAGEKAQGFSLYYGGDPAVLQKMAGQSSRGSVMVIETRALSAAALERLAVAAKARDCKVLAYLSIGELHSDQKDLFLKSVGKTPFSLQSIVVNENRVFSSFRVDALAESWRNWVHQEAAKLLSLPGIDGLFLDTVDTIDVYAGKKDWPMKRRQQSIDAMISLVRSLKHCHHEKFILQNGGLNLIGEKMFIGEEKGENIPSMALNRQHPDNPDGLLWENAFEGKGEWTAGRLAELRKIQAAGFTRVFALGYRAAYPKAEAFFEKCRAENFTGAWSESSELLHEIPAVGPVSP